jgi:hypothetical protein
LSAELTLLNDVDELLRNILAENIQELQLPDSIDFGSPPGRTPARTGLSLFLYQMLENPYLKNQEFEQRSPERLQYPPLVLDLYFLLTPFSSANNPSIARQVEKMILAQVMRTFHDNGILRSPTLGDSLLESGNTELRIVPNDMPIEQLYHLWTIFDDAFFRLSIPYIVTPLKIPSRRELSAKRVVTQQLDFFQIKKEKGGI